MISTETSKVRYSGNDSTTVFPVTFPFSEDSHLQVIVADENDTQTVLVLDTDYSVSGAGESSGSVTYPISGDPLPAGSTITINRVVPLKQLTDFENQGGFFAETHEDAFDYLMMAIQQQQEAIDRSVKVSVTSGQEGEDIYDAVDNAAQQALAYAEQAQGYAEDASSYATDAENSVTSAQVAQGLAETAQGLAEDAKDAAVIAQGLAEDAQEAAEEAAAGVNLPPIEEGDAGKLLIVKTDESGYKLTPGNEANSPVILDGDGKMPAIDGSNMTGISSVPVGSYFPFAGSSAPEGFLLCDGSAVSRETYAALFSAIGTAWGSGDGSTTFNVPNMKGRVPVGYDASQAEFDAIAESGGEKTHTLTTNEMPGHTHVEKGRGNIVYASVRVGSGGTWKQLNTVDTAGDSGSQYGYEEVTASSGGDVAHNNLQPYVATHYIIKY